MTTNYVTAPTQTQAAGIVNIAFGSMATDSGAATDTTFTPGFVPRYICWINVTDRVRWEWWQGMTTAQCISTAANGTVTLETTNVIVNNSDGTFTVKAAIIVASKTHCWEARG